MKITLKGGAGGLLSLLHAPQVQPRQQFVGFAIFVIGLRIWDGYQTLVNLFLCLALLKHVMCPLSHFWEKK